MEKTSDKSYRVLDLTEGGVMLGGRLLGDVGADVVKIEPPEGSASRIGPYYKNGEDPEKSLVWFAYNTNKRGITLDITTGEGQQLLRKMVEKTDALMESFTPGYMDSLGLGYEALRKINPDMVYTSVTPFGQTGPKSRYYASDLTIWASGAFLYICGDPDRAPVWIGYPQASLYGGAEGAIGTMTALWHRTNGGGGQFVDVSMQESAISPTLNVMPTWYVGNVEFKRIGGFLYVASTGVKQPIYFPCKDGFIMVLVQGGTEPFISSSARMVKWMEEENMAPQWLSELDWKKDYDAMTMSQETADKVGEAVTKFTENKTKEELYQEGAMQRKILIAPVNNCEDISNDLQLQARDYWETVEHPELNDSLQYCGPFIRMSESPVKYTRRAPLIGEHNREIYIDELGISVDEFDRMKQDRII